MPEQDPPVPTIGVPTARFACRLDEDRHITRDDV